MHAGQDERDGQHRSAPSIDLGGARCPRCPHLIHRVPAEAVTVVAYAGDARHLRTFVCPHCRGLAGDRIGSAEAIRLFAAGAAVARPAPPTAPLTEDELIEFGRKAAATSDLARFALEA